MEKATEVRKTIVVNDNEISTELASINIPDVKIPAWGKPLLERRMRCRLLECHPGGTITLHSHENRPAILYVLQGSGEEHSNKSDVPVVWKEGDCYAEYNDVEHWVKNLSDKAPLRILTFDLLDDSNSSSASIHHPGC
jgi:quercetin dioxygenase-like cupin family protein